MTRLEEIKSALRFTTVRDTWMIRDLAWAAGEVDRLQAIVDKLPKTADGVPVVPGMEVWHTESESWHTVTALRPEKNEWRFDNFYDVWDSECYSTREAAEAAK